MWAMIGHICFPRSIASSQRSARSSISSHALAATNPSTARSNPFRSPASINSAVGSLTDGLDQDRIDRVGPAAVSDRAGMERVLAEVRLGLGGEEVTGLLGQLDDGRTLGAGHLLDRVRD